MPSSRRSSSTPIVRTEAAIRSHRAVNRMFSDNAAQQRKTTTDRAQGRTWTSAHSGAVHGGLRSLYTPAQLHKLQQEGCYVDASGNIVEGTPDGTFSRSNTSCYLMNAQKQFHEYGREDPEQGKAALQNHRYSYTDALSEYNKVQSIIRHEKTIPKRRIVDKYVHLTNAQVDLHQDLPNRSAVRNRVRQHEQWVLSNNERQELARGKPLMSRIMAGEYYYDDSKLHPLAGDFVAINKKHLRAASAVSRVANAHAPPTMLPNYVAAPEPRKTIATLKTYNPSEEQRQLALHKRPSTSHNISVGHRHYLPHSKDGFTAGAKVANHVVKPVMCHHDKSAPMFDSANGSDTYVPNVWPPQISEQRGSARYGYH